MIQDPSGKLELASVTRDMESSPPLQILMIDIRLFVIH